MATIYFVDACPPVPYDASLIQTAATGGTTADVILLAEELAQRHLVAVLQQTPPLQAQGKALYAAVSAAPRLPAPDLVIYVRGVWLMQQGELCPAVIRKRNPDCRFVYTPHVTVPHPFRGLWKPAGRAQARRNREMYQILRAQQIEVVAVSAWHADNIRQHWTDLQVDWIYNPVAQPALPQIAVDPYKLLYASSPERGLFRAMRLLKQLRNIDPQYRLYVATPGYREAAPLLALFQKAGGDGVVHLGHLSRPELFEHMRSALCLVQPNLSFLESFGRVFVEAHMLGTPVLAHPSGAVVEIVGDGQQLLDARDAGAWVRRIQTWQQGDRPLVQGRNVFLPQSVATRWEALL